MTHDVSWMNDRREFLRGLATAGAIPALAAATATPALAAEPIPTDFSPPTRDVPPPLSSPPVIAKMFEGFDLVDIETTGARIRLRHGGHGPPLLLLHGNPMTHAEWHMVAPRLAESFHVVMPDLRGYGESSAPEPGPNSINYTFRAMAQDGVEIMQKLGYDTFFVAGHDRGGRVAHRMSLDHAGKVLRAAYVDVLPNYHIWTHTSKNWAMQSWHWAFMAQPFPLPDRLIASVPREFWMTQKLTRSGVGIDWLPRDLFDEYVRCLSWKTIFGSCSDYRACATAGFEIDKADHGRKVEHPVLILWGGRSHTGNVFQDLMPIWKDYATNLTGDALVSGHYIPHEAPEPMLKWFKTFFVT